MTFTLTIKQVFTLLCLLLLFAPVTQAQDTLDVDKAFMRARNMAFAGKRTEARRLANRILKKSPNYADVAILIGRTYSWDKKYDSARVVLQPLVTKSPPHLDALNALIDVELWSDNYEQAIAYADQGLKAESTNLDFQVKKVRALTYLKQYDNASALTQNLLKQNPGNSDLRQLIHNIRREASRQSVSASFQYDTFSEGFDSWKAASLAYAHATKLGSLTGRVNYANRFSSNGFQVEGDFYPRIGKKMYAYVNAGYAPKTLFPKFRSGVSLYRNLPKSYEAELGFRLLHFGAASNTVIYTGSVSKYLGNFWFSFRPFITPGDVQISQSYFLLSRYYFGSADDFITLTLGSGFSPDDNSKDVALIRTATLQSKKIRFDVQKALTARTLVSGLIGYDYQEYKADTHRNNVTFNVGIQQLF